MSNESQKKCSFDGCDCVAIGRGLCQKHYAFEGYRLIKEGKWKSKPRGRAPVLDADEAFAVKCMFDAYDEKKFGYVVKILSIGLLDRIRRNS